MVSNISLFLSYQQIRLATLYTRLPKCVPVNMIPLYIYKEIHCKYKIENKYTKQIVNSVLFTPYS